MRIAVLSDIHANVFALQAVLNNLHARGADYIVNLGDTLYGPIAPKATYDLLMQHPVLSICGNQDRAIFEATADDRAMNPTMAFVLDELGVEPLAWMRSLPPVHALTEAVFLCHGAPANDCTYLLEDISTGTPQIQSEAAILAELTSVPASLVLCGHSHIPRMVRLASGQLVVNPGSVGLPGYTDDLPVPHTMQTYSPHASYTIVEDTPNGWNAEFLRVPYDAERAAAAAQALKRPDWAKPLATGWV